MKMEKLPSPMLASVTMCNDKIVELNSKINGIRWFGISYTSYKYNKKVETVYDAVTPHLQLLQRCRTNEILLTQRNKTLTKYSQPFVCISP